MMLADDEAASCIDAFLLSLMWKDSAITLVVDFLQRHLMPPLPFSVRTLMHAPFCFACVPTYRMQHALFSFADRTLPPRKTPYFVAPKIPAHGQLLVSGV